MTQEIEITVNVSVSAGSAVAVKPETTQECQPFQTIRPAGRSVTRICLATMWIASAILSLAPTS